MAKHVAFLRAVNVGGRVVKMDRLRTIFERLGFSNVETFIASGNVIFESQSTDPPALEKEIMSALSKSLGYDVEVFVRTDKEIERIAAYKPFKNAQLQTARALNVVFLKNPLDTASLKTLMSFKSDLDDFHVQGREVYWLCRARQSESTFSNAVFERRLKRTATFRGVNTVAKIAAKYCRV
jgi:uncharacterized protein (DUF1697 family)